MCLAQGHNTVAPVGIELRTSRFGVRRPTTTPPRSLKIILYQSYINYMYVFILNSEFYGDLVYKFKKLKGINDFSFQFRKIITRYRRIGYNLNVM